jgi:hypothetical protein
VWLTVDREPLATVAVDPRGERFATMPRIRMHAGSVIKSPEMRKACTVLQNIDDALVMLDTLPVPVLEAIRDYVADQNKGLRVRLWISCAPLQST